MSNSKMTPEEKQNFIEFGRQIREIRNSKAWTQDELGELIGKDRNYISKIERGLQNVTFFTLIELADKLGSDIAAFTKNIPSTEEDNSKK